MGLTPARGCSNFLLPSGLRAVFILRGVCVRSSCLRETTAGQGKIRLWVASAAISTRCVLLSCFPPPLPLAHMMLDNFSNFFREYTLRGLVLR
jgi:hypothetical protein